MDLTGKTILITGGTGSFGKACIETLLEHHDPEGDPRLQPRRAQAVRAAGSATRDEERLRFLIGDVRDRDRLVRATRGVDVIVHAAALKQVPACEYNPFEAVQTNVIGAENVIDAAIDNDGAAHDCCSAPTRRSTRSTSTARRSSAPRRSSPRATPTPATRRARFACVRYGNVVGSRGSVIPLFLAAGRDRRITITDERMTRFWITLEQAVEFVLSRLERMEGGEMFVPKIPSMRVVDDRRGDRPGRRARDHRHPARREAARGAASPRTSRATRSSSTTAT